MKATAEKINPEDYILSVLSPGGWKNSSLANPLSPGWG